MNSLGLPLEKIFLPVSWQMLILSENLCLDPCEPELLCKSWKFLLQNNNVCIFMVRRENSVCCNSFSFISVMFTCMCLKEKPVVRSCKIRLHLISLICLRILPKPKEWLSAIVSSTHLKISFSV